MTTIRERYDIPAITRYNKHVGIEIEYEGVSGNVVERVAEAGGWRITDDHSLREGGAEFVSHPVHINRLQGKLNTIVDAFESVGRLPRVSHRCSTHVHVNVGDLHTRAFEAAYFLYLLLEDSLFDRLPFEDRKENLFALKASYYSETLERLLNLGDRTVERCDNIFLYDNNFRSIKYRGVSLFRTMDIGTVEFRILPAFPVDAIRRGVLTEWTRLFVAIARGLNGENAFNPVEALSDFISVCTGRKTNEEFFKKYYDEESAEILLSFFGEDQLLEPDTSSILFFLAEKLNIPERYAL